MRNEDFSAAAAAPAAASAPLDAPDGVAAWVADWIAAHPPGACRLLLDGAALPNLPERLRAAGADARCLTAEGADADLRAASPWLVPLPPGDRSTEVLLERFCRPSGPRDDPMALLDRRPGLLLASPLDDAALAGALRRLTRLPDEAGARQWFRLAEPGMLDMLRRAAPPAERAGAMRGLDAIAWAEPAMEDGLWRMRHAAAPPDGGAESPRTPVVDAPMRAALRHAVHRLRARAVARRGGGDLALRLDRARTIAWAFDAGHRGPDWLLLHFHRLLAEAPAEHRAYWWGRVEAGDESLAVLNRGMHDSHGTGAFAP